MEIQELKLKLVKIKFILLLQYIISYQHNSQSVYKIISFSAAF